MRRRRRGNGTWLPVLPAFYGPPEGELAVTYYADGYQIDTFVTPHVQNPVEVALLPDATPIQGVIGESHTLRDLVEGQDYTCDRIVGKIWATVNQGGEADEEYAGATLFCAAIAVLPVDDATGNPALNPDDYNPLLAENTQQPWLWRRTWVLQNTNVQVSGGGELATAWPAYGAQSTWQYGSVMDGGHIDTKGTKRRVSREQRLFMIVAGAQLQAGAAGLNQVSVRWGYDLRFHGGMRKPLNRSTFK